MLIIPVLALLGTGMALANTLAIGRGLLGKDRNFQRTPSFASWDDPIVGLTIAMPFLSSGSFWPSWPWPVML